MSDEEQNIIYPENIDQVSIINNDVKSPLARISLAEESTEEIFNNSNVKYGEVGGRVTYIISDIVKSTEDLDSVVATIVDIDFPDREFKIELLIQYANAAFLLSQMVKTPMFFLVPSDDMIASLGYGPYVKDEIHVVIEAPQRKTPEFNKITKLLFNLSKPTEEETRSVVISGAQIDEVRIELIDIVIGLMDGNPESLMRAYSHFAQLEKTNHLDDLDQSTFTESDKYAIVMKDMLLKLEQETHPVYLSTLFHTGAEGLRYVSDIEKFETILTDIGLTDDFVKDLEKDIVINKDSSEEDLIAYFSAPIDLLHMPSNIGKLISNVDNEYLWKFKWNTALEEEVNFKELNAGEFFVAMLFVVAIRLARLEELYRVTDKSSYSPLALMITVLTNPGEGFMWIVKESVKLLAYSKQDTLFELLTIPNDVEGRSPYSGPLGIVLHGIAHAAMDSGLTLESIELALHGSPNVIAFLQLVMEARDALPEQLRNADESACFIKGLVLPNMADNPLTKEEAQELINAVMIMGEMSAIKNTEYSMHSVQWREYLEGFYTELI